MRRIFIYTLTVLFVNLLMSCEQQTLSLTDYDDIHNELNEEKAFNVEFENNYVVSDGEAVSMFSSMKPNENNRFLIEKNIANGKIFNSGLFIAIYPYNEANLCEVVYDKNYLTTSIPNEQNFIEYTENIEEPIVSKLFKNDVMVGSTVNENINLKTLYKTIVLPIKAENEDVAINAVEIVGNNGEIISGNVKLIVSEKTSEIINVTTGSSNTIKYNGNITVQSGETKYVAFNLLPNKFEKGFVVTLTKENGVKVSSEYNPIDIKENTLLNEFLIKGLQRNYYIEYTSDTKILIPGYDCEEYDEATKIGRVYLNDSKIPDNLFKDNIKVKTIKLSATIEEIGVSAFQGTTSLVKVILEENSKLRDIKNLAFQKHWDGIEIDLSNANNLETIWDYAFGECNFLNVSSVADILPKSLKLIKIGIFRNAQINKKGILEYDLSGLNKLEGFSPLWNANGFTTLKLPSSLKNIWNFEIGNSNAGCEMYLYSDELPKITYHNNFSKQKSKLNTVYVKSDLLQSYINDTSKGWQNIDDNKFQAITE